jgi:hypothetical protein
MNERQIALCLFGSPLHYTFILGCIIKYFSSTKEDYVVKKVGRVVSYVTGLLCCLFFVGTSYSAPSDADAVAACFGLTGGCMFLVVAYFVFVIAIMVWVVKDAKARAAGSPLGWLILVLLTGPLGLIIYFFSRPSGEVGLCQNCHNKKLIAMEKCPHCGYFQQIDRKVFQPTNDCFCTKCGSKNQPASTFCNSCGSKLE